MTNSKIKLKLKDGDHIAVIGGGPAGSFFSYFALDYAQKSDLLINIDIYEAKDFTKAGHAGCNNCGGIISESLIKMLSEDGIVIPANVLRRGIKSYTLHMEAGTTLIDTPFQEQQIASVYRGFGPKGTTDFCQLSFDKFLLDNCLEKGAKLIPLRVIQSARVSDGIELITQKGKSKKYDLVVGAAGLNMKTLGLIKNINRNYRKPQTTKTHISEYYMDKNVIDESFGNSMHVFLLNIPRIKFGALIPKGQYVTMVLLGSNINSEIVSSFKTAPEVVNCFPPGTNLLNSIACQCFPLINVGAAKLAFDDRLVLIGDSGTSKLFKNGIGSAYLTAKTAAHTAIFYGISKKAFRKNYQPVCRKIDRDNQLGKIIFLMTTFIQKSRLLKGGMFQMISAEQKKIRKKRRMSAVLWNAFTGSASYQHIFLHTIHPMFNMNLLRNILKFAFNSTPKKGTEQNSK